jgi:dipeptidyl aminopeptidase/acylaminoacyl peptidase
LTGSARGTAALAFSPDGKVLAARGSDNSIRLFDVAKGSEVRQITAQPASNTGAYTVALAGAPPVRNARSGSNFVFSPDSKLLAMAGSPSAGFGAPGVAAGTRGSNSSGAAISLYDVTTGKEVRKIGPSQSVVSFAFSPDGRTLATENADQTITLWEVASGKERARLGKAATEPAPAPGASAVRVVNRLVDNTPEPTGPTTLAFSPDGRALVARGPDRSVRAWDVVAGKDIGQLQGHEGRIETVAFSADGKIIASGSTDTTVLLWDAASLKKNLTKPQRIELPAADVEPLWKDLAGEDAAKALKSLLTLASAPKQAVLFLSERLKPATTVDPQKIAGWIADLESETFTVRQEASTNLLKTGEQAVPALRKVLASQPPLETRKRVEELLGKLTSGTLTTEQLQLVRAVEALERMGTPEARQLLRTLAQGAAGTLPTREAQAALDRLERP